jgi:hypothetical protein
MKPLKPWLSDVDKGRPRDDRREFVIQAKDDGRLVMTDRLSIVVDTFAENQVAGGFGRGGITQT